MTLRQGTQPGGSEAAEEAPKKPSFADALALDRTIGQTERTAIITTLAPLEEEKKGKEEEKEEGAQDKNEKTPQTIVETIHQYVRADSDIIAIAGDDIINQYYQVVIMFLEHMLKNKTEKTNQRVQLHYLNIAKTYYCTLLRTYSNNKRQQSQQRTDKNLFGIFSKWETNLGIPNGFQFLTAIQSTRTTNSTTVSDKGTSIGGMTAITTETPAAPTPPSAQPAVQTPTPVPAPTTPPTPVPAPTTPPAPAPQYEDVRSTTGTSLYLPVMLGTPTPTPPQPQPDRHVALQAGFGVTVEEPADVETAATIPPDHLSLVGTEPISLDRALINGAANGAATPPPESTQDEDDWAHILAPTNEQLDRNVGLYNNPDLPTIIHIRNERPPASPIDWAATVKDLEAAMATSFEALRKNLAALETLSEADKEEIYKVMVDAISKTGSSKFRKRFVHEVHVLAKNVKGKHQREVIDAFNKALSNQFEYENPREPSELMEIIYRNPSASEPNPNDVFPEALSRGYSELKEAEIENMPEEIQEPLKELLGISREFGLAPFTIASGAESMSQGVELNIEQMESGKFRLMCSQIFRKLQTIEEETKAQFWHASTWRKKGPTGKAREFVKKLRQILSAQFAIMEELMFSKDLFIPGILRKKPRKS